MATKMLLTVDEFLPRLEERDIAYELVEGEVVQLSPTMPQHNFVRDRLLVLLKTFLDKKSAIGTVLSEQAFHLFGNTVRIPDISLLAAGRRIDPHRIPQGAPDLVVEVISPSNTPREIDQRVSDYFAAGCKRVWLVYPEHREVYIHGLAGVGRRRGDELLEDAELLPGFSLKVSSIFE